MRTSPLSSLLPRVINGMRADPSGLGGNATLLQSLRMARLLFFLEEFDEYLGLRELTGTEEELSREFLACLRYRHYLSKQLTVRQRVASLLHHARHEHQRFQDAYLTAVYARSGVQLWHDASGAVPCSIRLVAAHDNPFEGKLSVVLFVGEQRICVMSFSYVDATIFGLPSESLLFITRNQSDTQSPEKAQFIEAFKQNLPAYSCLAAISGVALAHDMTRIAAVKSQAQVAFEPRHARSFDHSYGTFWESFRSTDIDGQAALIPVPFEFEPVDRVPAKHRSRARARRSHWQQVSDAAHAAMRALLRPPREEPAPSAGGSAALGGLFSLLTLASTTLTAAF